MEKILFELSTERGSLKNGTKMIIPLLLNSYLALLNIDARAFCVAEQEYMVNIWLTFYDWRPYEVGNFQETFRDFCSILPSENYFSVLLRMIDKHKSACLCTVLAMYDQKYTKLTRIGNYYRIVTKF